MKKNSLVLSVVFVVGAALAGCATSNELERVQTQQDLISAKADKALLEAQAAKASADAATARADEAARIADEKAKKAEAAFAKSMKK